MDECQNEIDFEELEKLCCTEHSDDAVASSMVCSCAYVDGWSFYFLEGEVQGLGRIMGPAYRAFQSSQER